MSTNGYQHFPLPFDPRLSATALSPESRRGRDRKTAVVPLPDRRNELDMMILEDMAQLPGEARLQPAGVLFQALESLAAAIGRQNDLEGLLSALAKELPGVIGFDFIGISHYQAGAGSVHWRVAKRDGSIDQGSIDGAREETMTAWVYERQEPLLLPMGDRRDWSPGNAKKWGAQEVGSLCGLPLTCGRQRIGCLFVGSAQARAFAPDQVRLLTVVAGATAAAMASMTNFAALRQCQNELQSERDRLQLLVDLNSLTTSKLELEAQLRGMAANIRQAMQCDEARIHLPEAESGRWQIYAGNPPASRSAKGDLETENESGDFLCSHAAEVFRTREPILVNLPEAGMCCHGGEASPKERAGSGCFLPVMAHDQVLAVLDLQRQRCPSFSQGDLDFLAKVTTQIAIAIENASAAQEVTELKSKLAREKLYLEHEIHSEKGFEEIVGRSPAIRAVLRSIETVAPTDSTVLIYGETGTGKELIARAIHERSPRRANTFVKLNCAAIPTGLLESELFGHEKGAFTGAIMQRMGRFELANHGTAFLDEIAEISLELQPKLLRVLQEREFERLGSTRTLKTNARLIAATNRDLSECVEQQRFRADLFYRLHVFPILVPPLRDRQEDIPLLVRHFAHLFARRMNRVIDTVPSETMEALVRHSWPGNIRELQNLIEHSVIVSQGPVLRVPLAGLHCATPASEGGAKRLTMQEAEREHLLATLKETKWVVSGPKGAAARLGMNRSTLQFRMRRLGIARPGM